ncbi:hypothetical protein [Pseudomonas oryzihabitans]|uniref:hypothetical protein n=1 Tax=Pseudomonas oryzihabitans TaxID=47885 RepID=UPI0011AA57DD|nr:hypothetical protein [Pseudomonas psychrotolerans]
MHSLSSQLAALNPPLQHLIESKGEVIVFTLIDRARPTRVTRSLSRALVDNTELLYLVIRDAVNEIRALRCHAPITKTEIYPDD